MLKTACVLVILTMDGRLGQKMTKDGGKVRQLGLLGLFELAFNWVCMTWLCIIASHLCLNIIKFVVTRHHVQVTTTSF